MTRIANSSFRSIATSMYVAGILDAMFLGVYLILGATTIHKLHRLRALPLRTFRVVSAFVGTIFLIYVVFTASVLTMLYETVVVKDRTPSSWPLSTVFGAIALNYALGDALFTYRCWILWDRPRWIWVPATLLFGEFVTLVVIEVFMAQEGTHGNGGDVWGHSSPTNLVVAAVLLTITLNVLLACVAIARLLHARKRLRQRPVPRAVGAHHANMAWMLAGSTAVYAALWVPMLTCRRELFIITYFTVLFFLVAGLPLTILLCVSGRTQ